jgi:hypothetical protein
MISSFKKLSLLSVLTVSLYAAPLASAEIQCPNGWVKEIKNSVVVCVAQNQNQAQAQVQNNNQNQNVNQNVNATGGSSSSSSSSSSNANITINNPAPSSTPIPVYVPQVVYTAPSKVTYLPATGLPEAALGASAGLPILGLALRKFAFKKSSKRAGDSASSIWLSKNS